MAEDSLSSDLNHFAPVVESIQRSQCSWIIQRMSSERKALAQAGWNELEAGLT
jgi:hypothetical protein